MILILRYGALNRENDIDNIFLSYSMLLTSVCVVGYRMLGFTFFLVSKM